VAIAQTTPRSRRVPDAWCSRTRAIKLRRYRHLSGPGRWNAGEAELARHTLRRALHEHDDNDSVSSRVRVAVIAGGRSSEHAISVESALSHRGSRPEPVRDNGHRDRTGWALGACRRPSVTPKVIHRECNSHRRHCLLLPTPLRARSPAASTSCRFSTGPSARTAPCRDCSSSRACRMSAPASPPPPVHGQGSLQSGARDRGIPVAQNGHFATTTAGALLPGIRSS
jgi:hypothetical protein